MASLAPGFRPNPNLRLALPAKGGRAVLALVNGGMLVTPFVLQRGVWQWFADSGVSATISPIPATAKATLVATGAAQGIEGFVAPVGPTSAALVLDVTDNELTLYVTAYAGAVGAFYGFQYVGPVMGENSPAWTG